VSFPSGISGLRCLGCLWGDGCVRAPSTGGCWLPSGRSRRTASLEAWGLGALGCRYDWFAGDFPGSGFGTGSCRVMDRLESLTLPRRARPESANTPRCNRLGVWLGGSSGSRAQSSPAAALRPQTLKLRCFKTTTHPSAGYGVAFPPAKGLGGGQIVNRIHPRHEPTSKPTNPPVSPMQFQWHPGATQPTAPPIALDPWRAERRRHTPPTTPKL